ncbi:unnamed protein product [Strongylus vulgaris]|uniref:Uncharacterized protein n=1 Tax=Strongylus vulgaris TaxID=40348 RepID=A0A3P7IXC8_STRVU|nr:unnamed protein product [Strongylus vulgaris]
MLSNISSLPYRATPGLHFNEIKQTLVLRSNLRPDIEPEWSGFGNQYGLSIPAKPSIETLGSRGLLDQSVKSIYQMSEPAIPLILSGINIATISQH